jgi:hypothetical protein
MPPTRGGGEYTRAEGLAGALVEGGGGGMVGENWVAYFLERVHGGRGDSVVGGEGRGVRGDYITIQPNRREVHARHSCTTLVYIYIYNI